MIVGNNEITETDFDITSVRRFVADFEGISTNAVGINGGFKTRGNGGNTATVGNSRLSQNRRGI